MSLKATITLAKASFINGTGIIVIMIAEMTLAIAPVARTDNAIKKCSISLFVQTFRQDKKHAGLNVSKHTELL